MSRSLSDDEMKYTIIEKHTFALVKSIRKFMHFILGKQTRVRVPLPAIKFLFTQTHLSRKLAHWLAKIQEHDLMITIIKTIKGCDITLHLAQHPELGDSLEEDKNALSTLFYLETLDINLVDHPWYKDIIYYLLHQNFPSLLDSHQRRRLHLIASKYLILRNILYRRSIDGILLRCVDDNVAQFFLNELHGSIDSNLHIGGHFAAKATAFKIIWVGYFWPLMFQDSFKFIGACEKCQEFYGREQFLAMPLQIVFLDFPLAKWGLDFIDPINPPYSTGHVHILTITYYFTKWTEAVPFKNAQDEQVINFLESNIFTHFGLLLEIISDNGSTFTLQSLLRF
jgi:hypothetical protein